MTTRIETLLELPNTAPGTQRLLKSISYGDPLARPKIYLQAAIHADEIPGILVLHHLQRLLNEADKRGDIKGRIVLVPMANPYGVDQRIFGQMVGRYSLRDGVNFNRGHVDLSDKVVEQVTGQLGEDEAHNSQLIRQALKVAVNELPVNNEIAFLKRALLGMAIDADYCLDLHCDAEALLHLYALDSRHQMLTMLSTQLGCEGAFVCDIAGGNPFDEAVSLPWVRLAQKFPDNPIAEPPLAATIEHRGKADVSDLLAQEDADNLFDFMGRVGIVAGAHGPLPSAKCKLTPLLGVDHVRAPQAGILIHKIEIGDHVLAGDVVAQLMDPLADLDQCLLDITTRTTGIVYNRTDQRMLGFGDQIMCVAGEKVLHRKPGELLLSD